MTDYREQPTIKPIQGGLMPDIAKCNGHKCQSKHTCYRYVEKDSLQQWYFKPRVDGDKCEYYIKVKILDKDDK